MPFEVNTTLRWMAPAFLEFFGNLFVGIIYFIIICLLIESTVYAKTWMLDIKLLFAHVDGLAKCKNANELPMLESCAEAVDLHTRVYR